VGENQNCLPERGENEGVLLAHRERQRYVQTESEPAWLGGKEREANQEVLGYGFGKDRKVAVS